MKKHVITSALLVSGLALSANTQAGLFDDIGNWINDNIVQPIDQNVIQPVEQGVEQYIIDPISGAINDAGGYIAVVEEAATQVGFTGSVGNAGYRTPEQLAGASGQLKVAVFNIKGFPEKLDGISDARTTELARTLINGKGYDIIGFQENWVRNHALMSGIDANEYPYRSDHFQGGPISFGDGLSTVSRYPFVGRQLHDRYTDCAGTYADLIAGTNSSPDCETEKGFTFTEIQIAKDLVIHFYNTHMDTAGGSVKQNQLNQLQQAIASRSAGMPVIVMGDFNAWINHGQWAPGAGQSALGAMASNLGLSWPCAIVDAASTNKSERCSGVDHIAYRGNSQISFDTLSEQEVHQSISDHNPLVATLRWTNHAHASHIHEQRAVPVALRSYHNNYVQAQNNGGADVVLANRGDADIWESFTLSLKTPLASNPRCMQNGDKVTLRTGNGHYFRAHNNGNLDAGAAAGMSWETFTLVNHSDAYGCLNHGDKISLLSVHNDYVAAESDGRVTSNRDHAYTWETFTVEFPGHGFKQVPGGLKQVSTGSDGKTWGVNAHDDIFHYANGSWHHVGGKLSQISVGSKDHIWGVNSAGHIYRWQHGYGWVNVGGILKWVSVGADGDVWGVNFADDIFHYEAGYGWRHIGGKLSQISVGDANNVWGVNSANQIFRWQHGHGWVHVPGGATQVSAGSDGAVWLICNCGTVQYRVNNEWRLSRYANAVGATKNIAVGSNKHIWAIDHSDRIYNAGGSPF